MGLFDFYKCEFSKKCSGYQEDSFTCEKALDKGYCGIYKRFLEGETC